MLAITVRAFRVVSIPWAVSHAMVLATAKAFLLRSAAIPMLMAKILAPVALDNFRINKKVDDVKQLMVDAKSVLHQFVLLLFC